MAASGIFGDSSRARANRLRAELVALVRAMLTFQLSVWPYYFDEAGAKRGYLKSQEIGFICWVASMVVIAASSIWAWRKTNESG
jgi:hypothetical protein